ncbi:hypothetical protein [Photobacterium leiognathi]|uniref:hypothetical protein n=1 Tax=Photobacterium leiognathi TaxID=553611 RepID=UPI0012D880E5|nr:hypothetical protein [Photobacterium leiognathi]
MKNLGHDLGWNYISNASNQMSDLNDKKIKNRILNFIKSSFLPPIEWFIPYRRLIEHKLVDDEIIIEPGSRLIRTKNKYICYCENGLGIFSYNMRKVNIFNVWLAKKMIRNSNFIGFVFYSEASRKAAYSLLGEFIKDKDLGVIYPYARKYKILSEKKEKNGLSLGFCSNLFVLKSGREIVDSVINLIESDYDIYLDLVTRVDDIPHSYIEKIERYKDRIRIIEFNLSGDEFNTVSNCWDVYLHCSYFDSCPLTIIEMQNIGIDIIATSNFAIPELLNGYSDRIIDEPKKVFNSMSMLPRKKIFLDEFIMNNSRPSAKYEKKLRSKIESEILYRYELNDINSDNMTPSYLDADYIKRQWNDLLENIDVKR